MSLIALVSALWLGILNAISPCQLATNVAAVSFISSDSSQKNRVLASGLLYAFGRILSYVIMGAFITLGFLSSSLISLFLQKQINEILGPIMILLGLVLIGWFGKGIMISFGTAKLQKKVESKRSIFWAVPLGTLFALSLCPVSAGLFFGALIPLALAQESPFLLPAVYGIGSALPVIFFTVTMAFASSYFGKLFDRLTVIELWIRRIAGTAFILVGIYYSLQYIYGISW
jgi:cytochrome c-type biogenesis protein